MREILAAHPRSPSVLGYRSPRFSPAIDVALAPLGDLEFERVAAATAAYAAFFFASPTAARVLPGALVQGFPQPDGRRKHYVRNGVGLFVLTHMIVIGATLLCGVSIAPIVTAWFWPLFVELDPTWRGDDLKTFAYQRWLYLFTHHRDEAGILSMWRGCVSCGHDAWTLQPGSAPLDHRVR